MPSFTPGPWAVRRESAIDYRPNMIVGAEGQSLVAWCAGGGPKRAVMGPEEDANARLIAAAPDMLAALERIASGESDNAEKDAARAIAKATNEGDGTHPNQMGPWS